jgi:hypothetical protein
MAAAFIFLIHPKGFMPTPESHGVMRLLLAWLENRTRFFAVAPRLLRQILVDFACWFTQDSETRLAAGQILVVAQAERGNLDEA